MRYLETYSLLAVLLLALYWHNEESSGNYWYDVFPVEANELQVRNDLVYLPNSAKPFSGTAASTYENGQIATKSRYTRGLRNKRQQEWHSNGQILMRRYYKDGKPHGTSKYWYANGQVATEANFRLGKMHGEVREWSENGVSMGTAIYDEGNFVSSVEDSVAPDFEVPRWLAAIFWFLIGYIPFAMFAALFDIIREGASLLRDRAKAKGGLWLATLYIAWIGLFPLLLIASYLAALITRYRNNVSIISVDKKPEWPI